MTEIAQFYVDMDCDESEQQPATTMMPPPRVPTPPYTAEQLRAGEVFDRMQPVVMSTGFCKVVTDSVTGVIRIIDVPDTQS
jgi:hypothetical protein